MYQNIINTDSKQYLNFNPKLVELYEWILLLFINVWWYLNVKYPYNIITNPKMEYVSNYFSKLVIGLICVIYLIYINFR